MMISPVLAALGRIVERVIGGNVGRLVAILLVSGIGLWLIYVVNAVKLQRWFGG